MVVRESLAHDERALGAGVVVCVDEQSPASGRHAHHDEPVADDGSGLHTPRLLGIRDDQRRTHAGAGDGLEMPRLDVDPLDHPVRLQVVLNLRGPRARGLPELEQPVRVVIGQPAEEGGVDHREHRAGEPDGQPDGGYDCGRERGGSREKAQRVSEAEHACIL
jgi:hypothetical protein